MKANFLLPFMIAGACLVLVASCTVKPLVQDGTTLPTWPSEGDEAYAEIVKACGGITLPKCPKEKAWRAELKLLKQQLESGGTDQL